jgi:hypothetical protein
MLSTQDAAQDDIAWRKPYKPVAGFALHCVILLEVEAAGDRGGQAEGIMDWQISGESIAYIDNIRRSLEGGAVRGAAPSVAPSAATRHLRRSS